MAEDGEQGLRIGALSRRTGCQVDTIRYYERAGLLPAPARTPSRYRVYTLDHLKRLTFIRRARDLGFTLAEVRTLLTLADRRRRSCADAREIGLQHLHDVRRKIGALKAMERVLREMVARCADGTLPDCPLIEALAQGPAPAPRPQAAPRTWRPPGHGSPL